MQERHDGLDYFISMPVAMGNESDRYYLSLIRPMCVEGLFRAEQIGKLKL